MAFKDKETKAFQVRLPKELWQFLKKTAVDHEISMAKVLFHCVNKYKKDIKNILTEK